MTPKKAKWKKLFLAEVPSHLPLLGTIISSNLFDVDVYQGDHEPDFEKLLSGLFNFINDGFMYIGNLRKILMESEQYILTLISWGIIIEKDGYNILFNRDKLLTRRRSTDRISALFFPDFRIPV